MNQTDKKKKLEQLTLPKEGATSPLPKVDEEAEHSLEESPERSSEGEPRLKVKIEEDGDED